MVTNLDFKKQRSVGFMFGFSIFVLFISSLYSHIYMSLGTCYASNLVNLIFNLIISILFFLSTIKNNPFLKLFQIFIFVLISIFTSIVNNSASDTTAIVFFVLGALLAWSYFKDQIKNVNLIIYIFIFLIFFVILRIFSQNFLNEFVYAKINFDRCSIQDGATKLIQGISIISFLLSLMGFIWFVLVSEIKHYFEKSERIEKEYHKNEPYIWYGKNVTGVIHNIKNKLSPIYILLQELSNDKNIEEDIRKFIKKQVQSSDNVSDLLDKLLLVVKNKNVEEKSDVNINELITSILEFFKSDLNFKNTVNIELVKDKKDLILNINPLEFTQVIENMIKNSWDAIDRKKNKKILITIKNGDKKFISIKDNGCGIPQCSSCNNKNNCFTNKCNAFAVGKTTKKKGLGYGMKFIENFLIQNNFYARIDSKLKNSTEITIYFN